MIMQGLTGQTKVGKKYLSIKLGMLFMKSEDTDHEFWAEKTTKMKDEEFPQRGLWFSQLEDTITDVSVNETPFGTTQIAIDTALGYNVQVKYDSRYGTQLMEKLPNVDISKPIIIKPYDFTDKKTNRRQQGVTITQDGVKLQSAYYNSETKQDPEGFPAVPQARKGGKVSTAQWVAHFTTRNVHLLDLFHDWIEKQSFIEAPQQATATAANATNHIDDEQGDDGKVEDLPF